MKHKISITIIAFLVAFTVNAQEKKIKFNKGTLNICSIKSFEIEGYDGKDVIIKSLHDNSKVGFVRYKNFTLINNGKRVSTPQKKNTYNISDGNSNNLFFARADTNKKKGLKRLGKKQEDKELGIYFTIEKKNGELFFSDTEGQVVMFSNEKYSIKIPNSIKLNWDTNNCTKSNKGWRISNVSKTSSLSNFNGEVELSTSLSNFKLTDVTGPVSINSIGGNVTVKFDKKLPLKLYSIYTNNGFIDITMPQNSDVNVEANAAAVYSDINFKVLQDTESDGQQNMKLKLKRGRVKMKLEAGFGTVYLRKK